MSSGRQLHYFIVKRGENGLVLLPKGHVWFQRVVTLHGGELQRRHFHQNFAHDLLRSFLQFNLAVRETRFWGAVILHSSLALGNRRIPAFIDLFLSFTVSVCLWQTRQIFTRTLTFLDQALVHDLLLGGIKNVSYIWNKIVSSVFEFKSKTQRLGGKAQHNF